MAVITISAASGFDFDDLDFPDLTTGTTATKTATTWRVSQSATTFDEYTGKGLIYAAVGSDFVPNGGTITSFKHVENGVTQFQATKLSISGADYKTLFDGGDFGDLLSTVLQGNDTITGGKGDDQLLGFAGNDTIDGKAGNDTMEGGNGNDVYIIDKVGDVVIEGGAGGIDTIKSSIAISLIDAPFVGEEIENVTLTTAGAANVTGNDLANTLTGGNGVNVLLGLEGDDVLNGLGGNDQLNGGDDNDTIDGGAGNDKMNGGFGNDVYIVDSKGDVIEDADGVDTVQSKLSIDLSALAGGAIENLVLIGTAAANVTGNGEDNTLTGNNGANLLNGKAGADTMTGGKGADTYVVDDAGDIVIETLAGTPGGRDLVQSAITFELGANVEKLTLTGLLNIDGKGNELANLITGNDGNNRLDGLGGKDTLSGGKGNDTYVVDSVADKITETLTLAKNGGVDTVESAVTFSLAALANVENLTLTGSANINGTGNAAANVITGNSGNNKLDGGAGADTMAGSAGDDTYVMTSTDIVVEAVGGGTDTLLVGGKVAPEINLAGQFANVENVTWSGKAAFGINGSSSANVLTGGGGDDFLDGGAGNDKLVGNAGADWLMGGLGDDLLNGGAGNDTVSFTAGDGEDLIAAGTYNTGDWIKLQGKDIYDLNWDWDGAGNLYVSEAINGDYDFDDTGFIRIENFFGGKGSVEVMFDTENYNEFYGTSSEAFVTFQRGLVGTNNVAHTEIIVGQAGNDKIDGKGGFYDLIFGGAGNDTITGGSGGYDFLRGGNGNDVINGLGGGDDLRGEAGYDTLNGGDGFDRADYRNASFGVTVNLRFSIALDDGTGTEQGKGTSDFFFGIEDVRGSNFGDNITGNDTENYLYGLDGDDTLSGGGGTDGFFLGEGSDTIRYDRFGDGGDFIQDWNGAEDAIAFASYLDPGKDGILNDLQSWVLSVSDVDDNSGGRNVVVTFHNGATWTFVGIGNGTIDTLGELFDDPASQLVTYDDKEVFGSAIHHLEGGDGNDLLHGFVGDDTLNGGLGDDVLNPGADADGRDVVEFEVGDGKDTMMTYGTGDVIALLGTNFYDLNFDWQDRSLYIAQAIDGDYDFDDTGYVKLNNFFTGTGSINVTIDTANYNTFYGTDANISTFTFQRGLTGVNNLATAEVIIGTAGNDKINGNGGFYDALYGDLGDDTITGGRGTDFIRAGDGNDVLNGLAGNDTLRGDRGNDTLNGGDGNDRADYRNADSGVLVNLAVGLATTDGGGGFFDVDKLASIEDVRGSEHDDAITGDAAANVVQGLAGDDILTGAGGDDVLNGGDGADTFQFNIFGDGKDVIEDWKGSEDKLAFAAILDKGAAGILDDLGAAISKVEDLGAGNNVLVTFTNGASLTLVGAGTGAIDSIDDLVTDPNTQILTFADKTLTGTAGNDNLAGTNGHDVLSGLAGNDTMTGGKGNDVLDGGLGNDTYIFNLNDGFDAIAAGTYNTGDLIKIAGADFYDLSYGWNNGNLEIAPAIDGDYDFSDTGNITLANFFGGTGSIKVQIDTVGFNLDYGTDANLATFTFQRGLTGTNNATSAEVIIGTTGNDKINGKGGYYDALYGDDGNDTITGGSGTDWLRGGEGNDTMVGAGGNDRLRGEAGNDTLNGGDGIDRADYRLAGDDVNVDLNLGIASDDGHGTIDTLIGIENVRGGDFDDRITGNADANLLEGRDGADVLTGAGGGDTLNGAGGADTFRFNGFGEGHDVIEEWNGAEDILSFSDLLDTGAPGILDDLQAAIADVDDGGVGADVVVTFNNGFTVTFQGVGTGTITDITQLVTDQNTQITSF